MIGRFRTSSQAILAIWVLLLSSRLYGISFRPAQVPVWHPDVRYYDVFDAHDGKFLSGIYLDLFPREGKYKHAAAWSVFSASRLARRNPVSALVTNFNRQGLDHDEVETLLHEFGHVLHGALSRTDYNPHGGTNVVQDFVEAPSQMFEEWGRRAAALNLMREVCPACPALDKALIDRLHEAHQLGKAILYTRQHSYAAFDMALSSAGPGDALATWQRIEGETALGHVAGSEFPSSFSHIMNAEYGAGYYGYMWSEVLALDMVSAFGANIMDPRVGRRFRATILAQGGQVQAETLVRTFLGRAPDSRAFFAEITGQR